MPSGKAAPQRLAAEDRRRQIVDATIACLAHEGPEKWTLRQVARDLGVAPSLVTYFFSSWSDLVVASYRTLADRFDAEFSEIAARPGLPARERLALYVERYFAEAWMGEDVAGAYVAFWALARSEPRIREEMDLLSGRMRAGLFPLVAAYAAERGLAGDSSAAAGTLHFLLSGLWYELAVSPGAIRDPGPVERAWAFIDLAFPPG